MDPRVRRERFRQRRQQLQPLLCTHGARAKQDYLVVDARHFGGERAANYVGTVRSRVERIDRVDIHPVGEVDYAAGRNSFGERAFHHPERNTGDPVEGVDKELLNTQGRVMDRTLGRQQAEFESSVHFEILYMQPGGGAG